MSLTHHIHTLLVAALLIPYCAIGLALLALVARITWYGKR